MHPVLSGLSRSLRPGREGIAMTPADWFSELEAECLTVLREHPKTHCYECKRALSNTLDAYYGRGRLPSFYCAECRWKVWGER